MRVQIIRCRFLKSIGCLKEKEHGKYRQGRMRWGGGIKWNNGSKWRTRTKLYER